MIKPVAKSILICPATFDRCRNDVSHLTNTSGTLWCLPNDSIIRCWEADEAKPKPEAYSTERHKLTGRCLDLQVLRRPEMIGYPPQPTVGPLIEIYDVKCYMSHDIPKHQAFTYMIQQFLGHIGQCGDYMCDVFDKQSGQNHRSNGGFCEDAGRCEKCKKALGMY